MYCNGRFHALPILSPVSTYVGKACGLWLDFFVCVLPCHVRHRLCSFPASGCDRFFAFLFFLGFILPLRLYLFLGKWNNPEIAVWITQLQVQGEIMTILPIFTKFRSSEVICLAKIPHLQISFSWILGIDMIIKSSLRSSLTEINSYFILNIVL